MRITQYLSASMSIAVLTGISAAPAFAADHKEAPIVAEDPAADINDFYAFVSPNDPESVVFALTVNPFSAPGQAGSFNFSENVRYRFEIDLNNDGAAEKTIRIEMNDGMFRFKVPGVDDFDVAITRPTVDTEPNAPVITETPSGIRAFAGPRDDPFFFDGVGFNRFLRNTGTFSGTDSFANFNISAIVLELPLSLVAGEQDTFQAWAASDRRRITLRRSSRGQLERHLSSWQQVDRAGNPAVGTVLIPTGLKDLYNIGLPEDDAMDFAGDIVNSLTGLGTNTENINILASVALPDTLKIDAAAPSGYPNGRAPADDVIDTLLFFIFNQQPVSDGAQSNDVPFLAGFPFLAPPHQP